MKKSTPSSLAVIAACAGLLLAVGGCFKSSSAAGDGVGGSTGSGGSSGSGGESAGSGGAMGSGGSSAVVPGSGGRTSGGSGGNTSTGSGGSSVVGSGGSGQGGSAAGGSNASNGGNGGGGAVGSGGVTGAGGTPIPDAGNRDGRARDTAADAPTAQPDTGSSTGGDGGCVPNYTCKPVSPNTGDPYADCVARVNQFRACVCLPPLAQWTAGQACADQDAQYDSTQNTAHAGAQANICDWGNAQDECPDWGNSTPEKVIDGCLQMMFDEGPPPAGSCTGTCYSQHGHYINMTGTSYRNGVACGFFTTSSGSIWATQNFK